MMMDISKMLGMMVAFLPAEQKKDGQNWVLAFNYWNNGGRRIISFCQNRADEIS